MCRYRFRLRADGTIQAHYLWSGTERQPACDGSGKPPRPFDPADCGDCLIFGHSQPFLMEAVASVSIEHGKSAGQLLREYLTAYHDRGHREDT